MSRAPQSCPVVLAALLFFPPPAPAEELRVDAAGIRAHAGFLADDALRGRDTGSKEYEIAARYAATRFESYGLEPGDRGSFLQPVRFAESKVVESRLSARRGGGPRPSD